MEREGFRRHRSRLVMGNEPSKMLLSWFASHGFASRHRSKEHAGYVRSVTDLVRMLFEKDYETAVIVNNGYCSTYPIELIVIEKERETTGPKVNNADEISACIANACGSRVHGRFPFPVILVRERNICRSGTISNLGETVLNAVSSKFKQFSSLFMSSEPVASPSSSATGSGSAAAASSSSSSSTAAAAAAAAAAGGGAAGSWSLDQLRKADIRLLRELKVGTIFDLMVEQRKIKYYVALCSSEKVDTELRYSGFHLATVPYPGCEFFTLFAQNNHRAESLIYAWENPMVDVIMGADAFYLSLVDPNWVEYRTWDIIKLTKFYVKLLLAMIADPCPESGPGVLVHCISGWDRTPTFISLLRVLLWAEGEAHQSLTEDEMLYLTLGYDWMLFCHQLKDRRTKDEDIFYFAFYIIEFLENDPECSLRHWTNVMAAARQRQRLENTRAASTSSPPVSNANVGTSAEATLSSGDLDSKHTVSGTVSTTASDPLPHPAASSDTAAAAQSLAVSATIGEQGQDSALVSPLVGTKSPEGDSFLTPALPTFDDGQLAETESALICGLPLSSGASGAGIGNSGSSVSGGGGGVGGGATVANTSGASASGSTDLPEYNSASSPQSAAQQPNSHLSQQQSQPQSQCVSPVRKSALSSQINEMRNSSKGASLSSTPANAGSACASPHHGDSAANDAAASKPPGTPSSLAVSKDEGEMSAMFIPDAIQASLTASASKPDRSSLPEDSVLTAALSPAGKGGHHPPQNLQFAPSDSETNLAALGSAAPMSAAEEALARSGPISIPSQVREAESKQSGSHDSRSRGFSYVEVDYPISSSWENASFGAEKAPIHDTSILNSSQETTWQNISSETNTPSAPPRTTNTATSAAAGTTGGKPPTGRSAGGNPASASASAVPPTMPQYSSEYNETIERRRFEKLSKLRLKFLTLYRETIMGMSPVPADTEDEDAPEDLEEDYAYRGGAQKPVSPSQHNQQQQPQQQQQQQQQASSTPQRIPDNLQTGNAIPNEYADQGLFSSFASWLKNSQ